MYPMAQMAVIIAPKPMTKWVCQVIIGMNRRINFLILRLLILSLNILLLVSMAEFVFNGLFGEVHRIDFWVHKIWLDK